MEPFVAWSAARVPDTERTAYLDQLRVRMRGVFAEEPIRLPPLADFLRFEPDEKKRFKVIITRKQAPDNGYRLRLPEGVDRLSELRRTGFVLDDASSHPEAEEWRGFLTVRAGSPEEVMGHLGTLPTFAHLNFEVYELA